MMKKSLILSTAIAGVLTSGSVLADLSGNAAISSNYIWRGVTQTTDQAAGSGGIDWSGDSGVYVGTWVSNVNFDNSDDGYEMDVYAGYGGKAGDLGYDVGVISYQYPVTPDFNFTEVYASLSYEVITVGLNATVDTASGNDAENNPAASGLFDEGDLYLSLSADVTDTISIYAGSYMFDNDGADYSASGGAGPLGDLDYIHYGVSLSKDDFTFAMDKNDIDVPAADASTDNVRFTVSWSKEFEL